MKIDSKLVVIGINSLKGLGGRNEWLVGVCPGRILQERKTHVPNDVASLNYDIRVGKPLVGNHSSIHDLEGLSPFFKILNLSL
jgi:hypothetical protein